MSKDRKANKSEKGANTRARDDRKARERTEARLGRNSERTVKRNMIKSR